MTTDVPESKTNINNTESTMDTETKKDMAIASSVDTEMTIGQQLKEKRIELGLTEKDVATSLKISIDQVEALEVNNFDYFLSVTFARGFLKSYCKLLGLNQVEMLSAFDSKRANTGSTIKPVDKVNKQTHLGDPIVIFISVVIVAVLAFLVFWWPTESVAPLVSDSDPVSEVTQIEEQTPPTLTASVADESEVNETIANNESSNTVSSDTENNNPAVQTTVENDESETNNDVSIGLSAETVAILKEAGVSPDDVVRATAIPVKKPVIQEDLPVPSYVDDIEVAFSNDCWTEIRDGNGTILFSGVKAAGSTLSLSGKAPYRVVLGYSTGVSSFKYKGEEFDFSSFIRQDLARFELK